MPTTGERIKQARLAANMTQTDLANKIGVKFSAVHKYESGMVVNLKRETIDALAKALNVSPSWLMCLDDEATSTGLLKSQIINWIKNDATLEELIDLMEVITKRLKNK